MNYAIKILKSNRASLNKLAKANKKLSKSKMLGTKLSNHHKKLFSFQCGLIAEIDVAIHKIKHF